LISPADNNIQDQPADPLQTHLKSCQICINGIWNKCDERRKLQEEDMGWKNNPEKNK
jgi:hypothetical protein